ncbi:MAG: 50S ribosomal protein L28 [Alphaproteobacteria bacterium]|nr:50S ribosomal protein L28 [Alphaproteobacteria bacterium]
MSRRCDLTGTGVLAGNNVSHAKNRSRRRFLPNLQPVSLLSDALGQSISLRLTPRAMSTVDRTGGLDAFLLRARNRELTPEILRLKRRIQRRLAAVG